MSIHKTALIGYYGLKRIRADLCFEDSDSMTARKTHNEYIIFADMAKFAEYILPNFEWPIVKPFSSNPFMDVKSLCEAIDNIIHAMEPLVLPN